MFDLAEKAVDFTTKEGSSYAEAYISRSEKIEVRIEKDDITLCKEKISMGIGIRAITKNKVGFAFTTDLERIEDTCKIAYKSSTKTRPDPDFKKLPSPEPPSSIKDVYDKRLKDLEVEECIDFSQEMLEGCKFDPNILLTHGATTFVSGESVIVNSEGINCGEKSTFTAASITCSYRKEPITGYEYKASRFLDIDYEDIGNRCGKLVLNSLKPRKIESGEYDVVLSPFAMEDILSFTLIPSLSSEAVYRKRSKLSGKINEDVAIGELDILDDGTLPKGLNTSSIDSEGLPTKSTEIIKKGVLKSYLYDSYNAYRDGVLSTGNSVRDSFRSMPGVGPTNFLIKEGKSDPIEELGEGLFVKGTIGAHTSNPITCDFSLETKNAFYIKDGSIEYPVKQAMLVGNTLDLLKNIVSVGNDSEQVGSVFSPSILVEKMRVVA